VFLAVEQLALMQLCVGLQWHTSVSLLGQGLLCHKPGSKVLSDEVA